jgi:hypothetical protein
VLIAGDSFAGWGLGSTLEREIGKTGAQVSRFDKVSSGLCNPKFFDWNVNLKRLLAQTGAQAVILILGANDTHPMRDENGKGHSFGSEGWNEIYARRVRRLVDIAGEAGVDVFWMGLPIMGRKGAYNDEIRNVNAVASAACNRAPNCRFFDTYGLLADNAGAYRASLTTPDGRTKQLRAKDNVHLSMTGAEIMVSAFLKTASRWGFRRAPLPGSGARGPEPPAGSVRAAGAEVAPGPGGPPGARLPEGAIGTGEPAEPQAAPGAPAEPSQPGGRRAEAGGGLAMAG